MTDADKAGLRLKRYYDTHVERTEYTMLSIAPAPPDLFAVYREHDDKGVAFIERVKLVALVSGQVLSRAKSVKGAGGWRKQGEPFQSIDPIGHTNVEGFALLAEDSNYVGTIMVPNATPEKVAEIISAHKHLKWSGDLPD